MAALAVELDGVGQQVEQHLAQPRGVGLHPAGRAGQLVRAHSSGGLRRRPHPCRPLPGQPHAPGLGHRLHQRQTLSGQPGQVHRLQLQGQAAGLDAGNGQHIVDQCQQVAAPAQQCRHPQRLAGAEPVLLIGRQQLAKAQDGVHRRAQLVRHARQEGRFGPVGALGIVARSGQRGLGPGLHGDVGVGAHQAAVGAALRCDIQHHAIGTQALVAGAAGLDLAPQKPLHADPSGCIHVFQVFTQMALGDLVAAQVVKPQGARRLPRQAVLHPRGVDLQQGQKAAVPGNANALRVDMQHALVDVLKGVFQHLGLLRQQLTGLADLQLGPLLRADIGEQPQRADLVPLIVAQGGGVVEAVHPAAVQPAQRYFVAAGMALGPPCHLLGKHLGLRCVDKIVNAAAQHLVERAAQHAAHRRVGVDGDKAVVDGPEALLGMGLHQGQHAQLLGLRVPRAGLRMAGP